MGVSSRHARRILVAYQERGATALAHGLRGRRPVNTTPDAVAADVVHLACITYEGANHSHLSELLAEREGIVIGRTTLRRIPDHMYLDMWCAADEMGLEIMNNEHHQTATCMVPAAPIILGILARETKRARLLILGNPIANRKQPIRVAEEMALIDVLSCGRLECGFVRGVPYEISPANAFPYRGTEKLWEAHDLIIRDSPDQTNFPRNSSFWDTVKYNPAFQGRQMRPDSLKFPVFI